MLAIMLAIMLAFVPAFVPAFERLGTVAAAAGAGGIAVAEGSSMHTRVPRPGVDSICTTAPMRCARSRMMPRPTCTESGATVAGSKPTPLSCTSKRQRGCRCTRRSTRWALECLRTLDSASCTMCNTWICTSGASGRPWPTIVSEVAMPVWCSNLDSVERSADSMSSSLVRVRKCTNSSRTSA